MDFFNIYVEAEVRQRELNERISRATPSKIPSSAQRHLLAQRLHRHASRIED